MAIPFIVGKPGGGKGLCTMIEVNNEITLRDRCIITNFAIEKNPWVNGKHQPQIGYTSYLLREHKKTFEMEDRIFRLCDDAASTFFLFRALPAEITVCAGARLVEKDEGILVPGEFDRHVKWKLWRADCSYKERDGVKSVTEYDTSLYSHSGGHMIIVDEAWKFWGSRNWQTTGNGVIFYAKQHRKLADDFYLATQSTKDIDAAIVRVAQNFWVCRNRGLIRVGRFRGKDDFQVKVFESPPNEGSKQESMHGWNFDLDINGLAQCYDTTAGVGLTGRMAGDIGKKKVGLHQYWMWVAALAVPVAFWLLLHFGIGAGCRRLHSVVTPEKTGWQSNAVTALTAPASHLLFSPAPVVKEAGETNAGAAIEPEGEKVWCVGYILGKYPKVFLSDGRTADAEFGEVQKIYRWSVMCFGTNYPIVLKPRGEYFPEPVRDYQSVFPSAESHVLNLQVLPGIGMPENRETPRLNGFSKMRSGQNFNQQNFGQQNQISQPFPNQTGTPYP